MSESIMGQTPVNRLEILGGPNDGGYAKVSMTAFVENAIVVIPRISGVPNGVKDTYVMHFVRPGDTYPKLHYISPERLQEHGG